MIELAAGHIHSIPVTNLKRAERWYSETLGFVIRHSIESPSWTEMHHPGAAVSIGLGEVQDVKPGGMSLILRTTDLEGSRRYLREAHKVEVGDIVEIADYGRVCTFEDRDGNLLMLMEKAV